MRRTLLAAIAFASCSSARASESTVPPPDSGDLATIPLPPREPAPIPESPPTPIDDLIVTATKREEPLREITGSVFAFSGEQLERMGALELSDYLVRVPGTGQSQIQQDYNRISMRGIQSDSAAVTPQATGIFIDDVPITDPFLFHASPDLPPFDLAAVEVLKGPQGTLFGGSALAGAIRYRLADAVPTVVQAHGFTQYQTLEDGSPNRIGGAMANLPLGHSAALRLAGVRKLMGGTIDDLRNDLADTDSTATFSGRALLRWNPGDSWSIGLKAFKQRTEADDVPLAETTDGRFERERALSNAPGVTESEFAALDLGYSTAWGEFVSVSSVLHKYADLSGAFAERTLAVETLGRPISAPVLDDIRGVVQEFRLLSPPDPHADWRWLLGVFGHDYSSLTEQLLVTPAPVTGTDVVLLDFEGDVSARELAVFGETSRRFGEQWTATLGLRGYRVRTWGTLVSSGAVILATGAPENRNEADFSASGINPRIALRYVPAPHLSGYISVARGYRFGGIQTIGPTLLSPDVKSAYKPDSVWNYELGLRTQWFGNALLADGALFYIDWNDPQVQTSTGGAVPLNTIDNIGGARSYGAELSLRWMPVISGLEVSLAAAYTDARTTEPYNAPSGDVVPVGSRLPGSAKYQVVAALHYARAWEPLRLLASAIHNVQGPGVNDILQSMEIYDYQTTDLRVTLERPFAWGIPALSFGVMNLADTRAVTKASVSSETNFTTVYNRPRTIDLRLDLRF